MAGVQKRVPEGQWTSTIYTLLSEGKYKEVVAHLETQQQMAAPTRASLSILAYSYFYLQDYVSAALCYERLVKMHPEVSHYKFHHAQALYKSGNYAEAQRVSLTVDDPAYSQRLYKLQAYIKLEQDDISSARGFLKECTPDDPDAAVAEACLLFKEKKYEEAKQKFTEAMNTGGFKPSLAYNIALCHYQLKRYDESRKYVVKIIERALKEHPELGIGSGKTGEAPSVGNTLTLKETAVIEAFNLKAAIEYECNNLENAKESIGAMPPRNEEELDPISLHNSALVHMDENPNEHLDKLHFLLGIPQAPFPTFSNLLLLYVKYGLYDVAADALAANPQLAYSQLDPDLYAFLDALIMQQTSPDDSYRKFEELARKHIETLRRLTKQLADAKQTRDDTRIKNALKEFDNAVDKYIPVLMGQAKIYWNMENYTMVERLFRQSLEFCAEHETLRLNVAHVFFMQESKYKDAIRYYEPIVKQHDNILDVQAIVLANLCVAYIMTQKNDLAEELMRRIEKEEERVSFSEPNKKTYHLCIVNLVIGTLYCAKQNFEFGIVRIMKSLEQFDKKLDTDTWFYAKRCFLALADNLAKNMIIIKDATYREILAFLDECDRHGRNIPAMISHFTEDGVEPRTVSTEARLIKSVFLKLRDCLWEDWLHVM